MSRLSELHARVTRLPSLLPVGDEVSIATQLADLSADEIREHQSLFFEILDEMETSHTTGLGYLDKNAENRPVFETFAEFLDGLATQLPNQAAWLKGAATAFRLKADSVE